MTPIVRKELKDVSIEDNEINSIFTNFLLVRVAAKEIVFENVDFQFAIFDNCYFRKCQFLTCKFTGAKFIGSNFSGSSFEGCSFKYSLFERTLLDANILDACPSEENIRMRFARTLRLNFQQTGEANLANRALGIELKATEDHLFKAWRSSESYYRRKYKGWSRVESFLKWVQHFVAKLIWGNGESPLRLLCSIITEVVVITICFALRAEKDGGPTSYIGAFSDATAAYFGSYQPVYVDRFWLGIIALSRFMAVGAFVSIIVRKYSNR